MHFLILIRALAISVISSALITIQVAAAVPVNGQLDFTVMRNGKAIGTHKIHFRQSASDLNIDVKTDVAVKILFVTAYRFEHEGTELWRDGRLVSLSSATNDDGTPHKLKVRENGQSLAVVGDGETRYSSPYIIPASLWHDGILKGGAILNTLHGQEMIIQVRDAGADTVSVHGAAMQARHYVITGDLERELWFDGSGVLVKVRMKGKDGSDIQYVLN